MIREHRSREKLEGYYRKFVEEGVLDPNVHPWVAESWLKSRELGIGTEKMDVSRKLPKEEFAALQAKNQDAIDYLSGLSEDIREFFQEYNLSLLLIDSECRVLKSYSLPFYQMTPGEIEGVRVGVEDVGTSSISVAYAHQTPFWMFGPEMWVKECQLGDACSAPIKVNGEFHYIITLVSMEQVPMPQDAIIALLLTMKNALEAHLTESVRIKAEEAILDATPFAVYHVMPGGEVAYANRLGHTRLEGIGAKKQDDKKCTSNLNDVIMNYQHTPIYKGFNGVPSYNKEVTWITPKRRTRTSRRSCRSSAMRTVPSSPSSSSRCLSRTSGRSSRTRRATRRSTASTRWSARARRSRVSARRPPAWRRTSTTC